MNLLRKLGFVKAKEFDTLSDANTRLVKELGLANTAIENGKSEIGKLMTENESLKGIVRNLQSKQTSLEGTCNYLRGELDRQGKKILTNEQEKKDACSKIELLEAENKHLKELVSSQSTQYADVISKNVAQVALSSEKVVDESTLLNDDDFRYLRDVVNTKRHNLRKSTKNYDSIIARLKELDKKITDYLTR